MVRAVFALGSFIGFSMCDFHDPILKPSQSKYVGQLVCTPMVHYWFFFYYCDAMPGSMLQRVHVS